jgi:hypothetical protein
MAASAAPQQLAAQAWQTKIIPVIYTEWPQQLILPHLSLSVSNIKIVNRSMTQ